MLGWRAWRLHRVDHGLRIVPTTPRSAWEPRVAIHATCSGSHTREYMVHNPELVKFHRSPEPGCTCGVHAIKDPSRLARSGRAAAVVGRVAMWGRVIEHAKGYRAEFAYPSRLRLVCSWCLWYGRLPAVTDRVFERGGAMRPACERHADRPAAVGALGEAGRLEVGLGAGWNEPEFAMLGMPLAPLPQRIEQLDEACTVMKLLWTEERPSYEGRYYRLRDAVGEQRLDQLLSPDAQAAIVQIRTTAGDAGAERIQREVEAAFAPVVRAGATVTATSEPIIIAEMSEELSAFQAQAIGLTLAVVLALLTAYYALAHRRWLLGVIAMMPAVVGAALILGTMWVLDISFNVLTATLTAIAVGIGVPYGVHVVNRFAEDLDQAPVADAATRTLRATGAALTGSALTTLGAFVVLSFSGLPPMRSLGLLGGTGIAFAVLAAVLVQPGALVLWARRRYGHSETTTPP